VEDKHITYALRPENCWSPPSSRTCEHNWSRGKVHDIAYLGGHSVFYVELPSGKVVQSFVANAERRARPTWDDEVYVWWEDDSGVVLRS
jgi:putrescine transport system ATP-binding protein